MDFSHLQIEQQAAQLGTNIISPELQVQQTPPRLELNKKAGKLTINKDTVSIKVDSTPHRQDLNYKMPAAKSRELAQKGKNSAHRAARKYASQGDRMMENVGENSIIPEMARNSLKENVEIGLRWKRGPSIEVKEPTLKIEHQRRLLDSKLRRGSIESNHHWGKVEIYLKQQPRLEISVRGQQIDSLG